MNKYRAFINQIKGQMSRADESLQDELRSQMEQNSILFNQAKSELSELKPQVEMEQHLHEKTKKMVLEEFNVWWEKEETKFNKQKLEKAKHDQNYNPTLYENGGNTVNNLPSELNNGKTFIKTHDNTIGENTIRSQIVNSDATSITSSLPSNISSKTSQHIRDFEEAAYRLSMNNRNF